jgi:hypothetical protein
MKHVWNTTGLILIAVITLVSGSADARTRADFKDFNKAAGGEGVFSITAEYTGSLQGRIWIDNKQVQVPRTTPVYVVGRGVQEPGYFTSDETVYVSGARKGGKLVATMIVVRPSTASRSSRSSSFGVGVYSEGNPQ